MGGRTDGGHRPSGRRLLTPAQIPAVLHVIEAAPYGGAESVVRVLVRTARRYGRKARVALLNQGTDAPPLAGRLVQDGVEVSEIRCGRRRYLAEVRELARLLERTRPDVVHTHVYHANLIGLRAARRAHLPIVATVHGFTGGDWKNQVYQWIDRRILRSFDAVMCVSEALRDQMVASGCSSATTHVVPNGIDPDTILGRDEARRRLQLPTDEPVVGYVGRLSREKGPDILLRAFAALDLPRAVLVMVGDGPERAHIRRNASRLGIAPERLRLPGAYADASTLLAAFDVLVLSSRTEGLPMVLLEAMSAGIPIVATAVGSIPDTLPEDAGWIAPPDNPAALCEALRQVFERQDEARTRALRARRIALDRFGARAWMEAVEAVYAMVLR